MAIPCFIDCEASSLSGSSYPIEIAWSDEQGSIEVHLINPYFIREWTDWCPSSQHVHGLSRNYLSNHGEDPRKTAQRMNSVLNGKKLYSDAPDFDDPWVRTLFQAVGLTMNFEIANANSLLQNLNPNNESYKRQARKIAGPAHRAGVDVAYLLELYRLCIYPPTDKA